MKQGDAVEAKAAYAEALKLREATGTATHPNAADAMKGLADVAVMQDEFTSATTLASRAQATLDASVVPTHPRTAPTLIALSSLYIMSNQPDQATPLLARIDTILQKPSARGKRISWTRRPSTPRCSRNPAKPPEPSIWTNFAFSRKTADNSPCCNPSDFLPFAPHTGSGIMGANECPGDFNNFF